jgi:PAS domain S-box-containing protein/putative nucleotidyltransferase with HDIG domain
VPTGARPDDQQPPYIILLTALDNKESVVVGLKAGADDYVEAGRHPPVSYPVSGRPLEETDPMADTDRVAASRGPWVPERWLQMGLSRPGSGSVALPLVGGTQSNLISGTTGEAVLLADGNGTVIAANPRACDLLARTEREICQLGLAELAGEAAAAPLSLAAWLHDGHAPFIREAPVLRGDGATFPAQIFVGATTDCDSTVSLVHITVRDLRTARRAEVECEDYHRLCESLLKQRAEEMREAASRIREEIDERRQVEERFRMLVEHSSDLILIVDAEARVTYCSPSVERLVGYSQNEVTGRTADEFIEGDDLAFIAALRSQAAARRAPAPSEGKLQVRKKDGTLRWFGWAASNRLDDEMVRGIVINARDITDHVAAVHELRANEAKYRALTEASPDMIYVVGSDGRVEYANGRAALSFAAPTEKLVGMPLGELFAGETTSRISAEVEGVLATGEPFEAESQITYPIGQRCLSTRLVPLHNEEGFTTAVLGVSRDVTERKLAQDALAQSERRYRSLFEDSPVAKWEEDHSAVKTRLDRLVATGVGDIEGYLREHPVEYRECEALIRTVDVNRAAVALCGAASREELIEGKARLYPADCMGSLPAFWAAAMAGQSKATYEDVCLASADRTRHVMETYIVPPGHEDTLDRVYIADVDVSEHCRAEELLSRYRLLFAEARDVMLFVSASDGHIVEANAAAETAYGYSRAQLLQLDIAALRADLANPGLEEQLRKAATEGALFETEHRRKDGSTFPVEVSSRGIATAGGETLLLSVIRDVTAREQTAGELTRATARLERTVQGSVAALGMTAELRDPYTAGHQRRVAELARAIAGELGWSAGQIAKLRTAALLHDLGKIVVPAEILSKPGKLTETEFLLIRQHSTAGAEILADIDFGYDIATMVRQHHERLDGSGYPDGLKGADIVPEARLLAVADVLEAMVSHRPYRPALPLEVALAEIADGSGSRYDADVCVACVRLLRDPRFIFELLGTETTH